VDENDSGVAAVLRACYPTDRMVVENRFVPCHIGGQLGSFLLDLAEKKSRELLNRLESVALQQNSGDWLLIFATFATLMMALDRARCSACEESFRPDMKERGADDQMTDKLDQSAQALMSFYRACFPARLGEAGTYGFATDADRDIVRVIRVKAVIAREFLATEGEYFGNLEASAGVLRAETGKNRVSCFVQFLSNCG